MNTTRDEHRETDFPMHITAAVARTPRGPFTLEPVQLLEPRADEVLVKLVATGMCHTDLSARNAELPTPLPAVLGHEGSGVVVRVGSAVTGIEVGDHVVLAYLSCGECAACQAGESASCVNFASLCFGGCRPDGSHALCGSEGERLNDRFFGQSSFAPYAVAHQRCVVKVRKDAPLALLGPLGCGVMTGAGVVWNVLKVAPGSSFAVYGAGAVGLSAMMAARVAGATRIICVDRVPSRLALAKKLGATHLVDARTADVEAEVRAAAGTGAGTRAATGADAALDTTGRPEVIKTALRSLGQRGKLATVAISATSTEQQIDLVDMIMGCKSLMGVVEGGSHARATITRLVDLHMDGRFAFDELMQFYDIGQINEAAEDSLSGKVIKPIIRF
ncbi:MAG: NAD(P)-dependent alcohol dehydrogenase [Janthinobacterium lividum]